MLWWWNLAISHVQQPLRPSRYLRQLALIHQSPRQVLKIRRNGVKTLGMALRLPATSQCLARSLSIKIHGVPAMVGQPQQETSKLESQVSLIACLARRHLRSCRRHKHLGISKKLAKECRQPFQHALLLGLRMRPKQVLKGFMPHLHHTNLWQLPLLSSAKPGQV